MTEATDPIARFADALARARAVEPFDATAMAFATADAAGRPSVRIVLLKGADARGFVFFTNRESRKGHELAANPFGALTIHWPKLAEQVRAEGRVEVVSDAESDAYFATRARGSQIGAWASRQSSAIASREELEVCVRELEAQFPAAVPRPPFWGGYRLVPDRIEFWINRENRLHDRISYTRQPDHDGAASGPKPRSPAGPDHDGAASGPKPRSPLEPERSAPPKGPAREHWRIERLAP